MLTALKVLWWLLVGVLALATIGISVAVGLVYMVFLLVVIPHGR